jgi:hypothetical protein
VRAAVAALALVVALLPRPSAALEIGCWPLFAYASDPESGDVHWSALGPLVEYRRTAGRRELAIRPLLWLQGDAHDRSERIDVLYPIAAAEWRPDEWWARFLLLSTRRQLGPASPDSPRTRFALFPFVFYREAVGGAREMGLLPFYLDLRDVLGWSRVRAIAFPLYLALEDADARRTWMPFPLVSIVDGPAARGFAAFPFYGETTIADRESSGFALWPFVTWDDRTTPAGVERRRVYFPALATIDGPERTTRGYGLVGWIHSIDRRRGTEMIGSPWPLVVRERALGADAYDTWRLFPVYGRASRDGIERRFYLWPAFRTLVQDQETFHFRRRDAMLILWRSERSWDDASGRTQGLSTLVGLWRIDEADGRTYGQVPAPFDSLVPYARGVRALWAPLTALVQWADDERGTDWSVLFGLVGRRRGRLHGPWYVHRDER